MFAIFSVCFRAENSAFCQVLCLRFIRIIFLTTNKVYFLAQQ